MFLEFLTQGDLLVWPVIGLVIFFTVFVGVLLQVLLGHRGAAAITALPLADDERPARGEGHSR